MRRRSALSEPKRADGHEFGTPHTAAKSSVRESPAECASRVRDDIRLGFLIHDVSRMRATAYDHLMKPLGVTRAQWWVLAHLSRRDGMMQTELAAALDVGKASLGSVIDRLAAAGCVERREVPGDRRARRIYLRDAGYSLLRRMAEAEVALNERILGDLSAADRETTMRTLSAVKQALSRQLGLGLRD